MKFIVAYSKKTRGIGFKGGLPWDSIPSDMNYFKRITTTTRDPTKMNCVIMGRHTWESIPSKHRPLPNRLNIVISRSEGFESLGAALEFVNSLDNIESIFVIGGEMLYREALPKVQTIYATEVDEEYECDTFFPMIPENFEIESKEERIDPMTGIKLNFIVFNKK